MNKFFTFCKTTHYALVAIVLAAFSVVGCTEKDVSIEPPVEKPTVAIPPVTLDTYHDFNPVKKVEVNIDYSGANTGKTHFDIYAENPYEVIDGQVVFRNDLTALGGGYTDDEGKYTGTAKIPVDVDEVYIYSDFFGTPTLYKTNLVGNALQAQIDFENDINLSEMIPETKSVQTRAGSTGLTEHVLGTWNKSGYPEYVDGKSVIDETMMRYITSTLPEGGNATKTGLISDDADITLYENAANVWISYFGGKTSAQSAFAYYCYKVGDSLEKIKEAARHACLIFPSAHPNALGDYSGVKVKLRYIDPSGNLQSENTVFPKDTRIGFVLFNNSWKSWGNGKAFYSTKSLNADKRSHTAMFKVKNNEGGSFNVISMEDWSTDNDYNDVAFVITSDPEEAIVLPPAPDPGELESSLTYRGLLAFEDNWPKGGDYDMNDVVVKYVSNVFYNGNNRVTKIVDKFSLAWSGANYSNGFGYQVPFDLSKVKVEFVGSKDCEVVGNDVILLTNDVKRMLGVPGIGAEQMPESVPEASYTTTLTFDGPWMEKEQVTPPYNPFIKIRGSNTEVHLVNHPTTPGADNVFDGSSMDISDGKETFFISKEGYPFAFHIDARIHKNGMDIKLKHEGQHIDEVYPKFVDWAKEGRPDKMKWW